MSGSPALEWMSLQPHASQAMVIFGNYLTQTISCDIRCTQDALRVCDHRNIIPLSVESTWSLCHFCMQGFLRHLSLGRVSNASCVVHYWNCLFTFSKKINITVWPCQKSGERQQRCDNPRVKGVNMRREFHAWQVRRMAPVFSLFTHANEQYADEQTWSQPRLPAAQNWQEACWCGSPISSWSPLVCCSFWWLFKRSMLFPLTSKVSAMYRRYSVHSAFGRN